LTAPVDADTDLAALRADASRDMAELTIEIASAVGLSH
jgi:hypothetical protein